MPTKAAPSAAASDTTAAAQQERRQEEERAASADSVHCTAAQIASESATPRSPMEHSSPVVPITSHLSSGLRQRLSRGAAKCTTNDDSEARLADDEEKDESGQRVVDSAASSATTTHWHRHNPYATSPAQSQPIDDAATTPHASHLASATGAVQSPPQVTVHMHSGSNRVSRTTSMLTNGDTLLIYSLQQAHGGSSLPSSNRVSRTTSMVKGNESIGFGTPQLRFPPSQNCSAQVSRTTSMVKTDTYYAGAIYNHMEDSIPILLQPSMQHQPQTHMSAVSPLLRVSPHASQPSLFSPGSFSTEDQYSNPTQRSLSGSAAPLYNAQASSSAFHFNASAASGRQELYAGADMYAEGEVTYVREEDGDGMSGEEHTDGSSPQQQQRQRQQNTSPDNREDGASVVSIHTSLTGYVDDALRPPPEQTARSPHYRRQAVVHRFNEEVEVTRGVVQGYGGVSPTHSSPHTPPAGRGSFHFHPPHGTEEDEDDDDDNDDRLRVSVTAAFTAHDHHEGSEAGGGGQRHGAFDPQPNELGSTRLPRAPHETIATASNASSTAAAAAAPPPSSIVIEMTNALEEAKLRSKAAAAAEGDARCPPGSLFSVYDAGMKEHYSIPSEKVALTRGAIKYVSLFERYGNQTRFRFQLCKRYLHNRCTCGLECQYIHSQVTSGSTQVHMNENSITASGMRQMRQEELAGGRNTMNYPTVPPGMIFAVFPPNQVNSSPQFIPSELVLVTEGAVQTQRALASIAGYGWGSGVSGPQHHGGGQSGPETPVVRPRHCAHFQFKRMCNLGASCHFIHSLIPFIQGMVNQPPLPYSLDPATLDERGAGFVLSKNITGEALPTSEGTERAAAQPPAAANGANALPPLQNTVASPSWPAQIPTPFVPEPSVLPISDAQAQLNSMYGAAYAQGVQSKMPVPPAARLDAGDKAMHRSDPADMTRTGWSGGFPQSFNPYSMAGVAAMAPFDLHGGLAPPVATQPPPPVLIPDMVGGFHSMMPQPAQAPFSGYANATAVPQPWPPESAPHF